MAGSPAKQIDLERRRRLERGSLVFCVGSALLCLVVYWLTAPLDSQQEIESHLERPILAFDVWDGTTYIVFEYGEMVHFDQLVYDPVSLDWPPLGRWQWSGNWSSLPVTSAPASVAVSDFPISRVLFGQINDTSIVTMEADVNGTIQRFAVAVPGFMVQYEGPLPPSTEVRWLNADGNVVWTSQVQQG